MTFTQLRTNTAEIFPTHIKEDVLARKLDRKGTECEYVKMGRDMREREREMERKKGKGRERNKKSEKEIGRDRRLGETERPEISSIRHGSC